MKEAEYSGSTRRGGYVTCISKSECADTINIDDKFLVDDIDFNNDSVRLKSDEGLFRYISLGDLYLNFQDVVEKKTTYFVVEIGGKVIYGAPSWDDNGRHVQERVTMKTDTTYHSPSYVSQTPQMYRTKGLAEAVIKKNREYKLLAEHGLCNVIEVELKVVEK